jgi:hypothetical protein
MARLPTIQFKQFRSMPTGPGPGLAVADYRSRQGALGAGLQAAASLSESVATRIGEDDALEANAGYQQDLADFEEFAAQNPTATRAQLEDFAAEHDFDLSTFEDIDTSKFDARGEEALPAHVWYADGMKSVMEQSRDRNAEKIAIPQYRRAWSRAAQENGQQVYNRAQLRAAQMGDQYEYQRNKDDVQLSIETGNLVRARDLLKSSVWDRDPIGRTVMERKVFMAEKLYDVKGRMLMAESTEDFDLILEDVMDAEWVQGEGGMRLTSDEQLQIATSVIAQRNSMATAAQKQQKAQEDANAMNALIALSEDRISVEQINRMAPALGEENHRYLLNWAISRQSQGVTPNQGVINSLRRDITALQFGMFEGEFDDSVIDIQSRILQGIGTAFDSATARQLQSDIQNAMERPYTSEEFKFTGKQINNYILGTEDPMAAMLASENQRQQVAEAFADLRSWVELNGGTRADLAEWREKRLPAYMGEAAKADLVNLSEDIADYVVFTLDDGLKVDLRATDEKLEQKRGEAETGGYLNNYKKNLLLYEQWLNKYGEEYGTY